MPKTLKRAGASDVIATRPVTDQDYQEWNRILGELERVKLEIQTALAAGVPGMDTRQQVCDETCQQLLALKAAYFPEKP